MHGKCRTAIKAASHFVKNKHIYFTTTSSVSQEETLTSLQLANGYLLAIFVIIISYDILEINMCSKFCLIVLLTVTMAAAMANASTSSGSETDLEDFLGRLLKWKPRVIEPQAEELATAMQKQRRCGTWSRLTTRGFTFTVCLANGGLCLDPMDPNGLPPYPCTMIEEGSCENKKIEWQVARGVMYQFTICRDGQVGKRCAIMPMIKPCGVDTGYEGEAQAQQTGRRGPCYCITGDDGKKLCDPRCSY